MKDSAQHPATPPGLLRVQLFAAALLLALAPSSAKGQATDEVVEWLRERAIPIQTVEPGHGFEDLEPLRQVIGDARIVALGEATHGTREFFLFKHRMLEFLVTQMGFTVLAIEANWPETLAVNEYVQHGIDDPVAALADMAVCWDSEEFLAMIRWMRQYNDEPAHTQKVQLIGLDSWSGPSTIRGLTDYLEQTDPEYARQVVADLGHLMMLWPDPVDYRDVPRHRRQRAHWRIREVLERLEDHGTAYTARTSPEQWARAQRHAVILQQAEQRLRRSNHASASKLRECQLAENVRWILEQQGPEARIILWAHNLHVARAARPLGHPPMGAQLTRSLGNAMVVSGFAFNQGSFQAWQVHAKDKWPYPGGSPGLKEFTVGPAMPGSLDATLSRVGLPMFMASLQPAPGSGPVAEWLHRVQPQHAIGTAYSEEPESPQNTYANVAPIEHYDVIFFVERTTAARPTPGCLERLAEYKAIEQYARELETATTQPADGDE